jgi:hypothetical protein
MHYTDTYTDAEDPKESVKILLEDRYFETLSRHKVKKVDLFL